MTDIQSSDERTQLEAMLDFQRAEIAGLLDGLSDEEARRRLVPSLTTPLSLVKHAVFVEKVWFPHRVGGRSRADVGIGEVAADSFVLDDADTVESVRAAYLDAVDTSRDTATGVDLDETFESHHGVTSLRWVYLHMIAELARHAGHGDILVEQIRA